MGFWGFGVLGFWEYSVLSIYVCLVLSVLYTSRVLAFFFSASCLSYSIFLRGRQFMIRIYLYHEVSDLELMSF